MNTLELTDDEVLLLSHWALIGVRSGIPDNISLATVASLSRKMSAVARKTAAKSEQVIAE